MTNRARRAAWTSAVAAIALSLGGCGGGDESAAGSHGVAGQGGRGGQGGMAGAGGGARDPELLATIPVHVDVGAVAATTTWPTGVGVVFPEGMVGTTEALRLTGDDVAALPIQPRAKTLWPDGTVQWAWVDFVAGSGSPLTLRVYDRPVESPAPPRSVAMQEDSTSLRVDTGAMAVTWDKVWATPTEVRLDDAPGISGDGAGIFVTDSAGRSAVLGGPRGELDWDVEIAGPLHTVVRVEGWYVTDDDVQVARGIVRYHLHAERRWLSIEHTFVFAEDTYDLWFREVGVRMPWSGGADTSVRLGVGGDGELSAELSTSGEVAWIAQEDYPHYRFDTRRYTAGLDEGGATSSLGSGEEAAGWTEVSDDATGLTMVVRDFAPQFPKELAADRRGATALLWSSRAGLELDYRPASLAPWYYGESWIAETIGEYLPGWDLGDFVAQNPTGLGSARTHQILVAYHEGRPPAEASPALHAAFDRPAVAHADTEWLVASGTLWPIASRREGQFDEAEAYLTAMWERWMEKLEGFPMAGWIGRGMIPELQYTGSDAQFYRLNNVAAYNAPKHIWVFALHTGERDHFDFAERYAQFLSDFKVIRWGGGDSGKEKGLLAIEDPVHLPFYWSGSGALDTVGQSTDYMVAFRLAYLLRDAGWARDALELYSEGVERVWTVDQMRETETPFTNLSMMVNAYRVLGHEHLAEKCRELFAELVDLDALIAVSPEFFAADTPEEQQVLADYKPDRKITAYVEYFDAFGDELAKEAALVGNEHVFGFSARRRPISYQNTSAAYLARAYEWTGRREYAAAAAAQLRSAIAHWHWADWTQISGGDQGFALFSVPHILALVDDADPPIAEFPYVVSQGLSEDTPVLIQKAEGEPAELLFAYDWMPGDDRTPVEPVVRDLAGSTVGAATVDEPDWVPTWTRAAVRVVIPAEVPGGTYAISMGATRFMVIRSSVDRIVLYMPGGTSFGALMDGSMTYRTGFELARAERHYFEVPSGRDSFAIRAEWNTIRLFDPAGVDRTDLVANQAGEVTVPCAGSPGLWSFSTNERDVHVELVDLPPVVASGDPSRYFVPSSFPP